MYNRLTSCVSFNFCEKLNPIANGAHIGAMNLLFIFPMP